MTILLALLMSLSASPQPLRATLLSPERLPWNSSATETRRQLESLGFDGCEILGLNQPATIGPIVRCRSAGARVSALFRTWESGDILEKFVLLPKNVLACRQLLEAAVSRGYVSRTSEHGERVLELRVPHGKPARDSVFQLDASCVGPNPRIDVTRARPSS